jgi:hypothetical protein
MNAPPEQVIRNYLDQQDGETEARVEHLLTTFGVDASDEKGRERIAESLASTGVEVDRPLAGLAEGEPIRLSVVAVAGRRLPPPLSEHSRPVQVVLAGVVPALYGALTGVFLGVSEPVYLVLSLIGILGGVGAGFDHIGARAGALRGVVAGSVFGAFILIAHEIHGEEAKAHLPEPAIVLVAITTGLAVPLAGLGGWLRQRQERKAKVREGPAVPGPLG